MKKILDPILEEQEVPEEIKEKLLESAKLFLLVKNLGNLFLKKTLKSSVDIIETVSSNQKND